MKPKRRPNQGEPLTADFPLATYSGIPQQIKLQDGPFDPSGEWAMKWSLYACIHGPQVIGDVTIRRDFGPIGGVSLRVHHTKKLMGGTRRLDALLHIGKREEADSTIARLSTPRWWSFRAVVLGAGGRPIPETRLERRLEVLDGKLRMVNRPFGGGAKSDSAESKKPTSQQIDMPADSPHFTTRWALFDAVARMAVEPVAAAEPMEFTLIDHCDQVKPDQRLIVRGKVTVELGGKPVEMTVIDQLGRGVMPFTYWIDSAGRPLLITTGLETYVLESASNV